MRVVSVTCSNTEIVCALGCAEFLVGVDSDSDHPADVVGRLPRVGRDLDVDAELVASLRPDLVLASLTVPGHEHVVARLRAAGLDVLAPEPVGLADVYEDIRGIAERLGVRSRAEALVESMQHELEFDEVAGQQAAVRPSVLVQWWPKPVIAPGRQSWVHDLIVGVGGHNPLGQRAVKSEPIADEQLAALAPDIIVVSWCGVATDNYRLDVVRDNPRFASVPAVRNDRIFAVPEAYLGRPGPRLVEGARALRRIVATVHA